MESLMRAQKSSDLGEAIEGELADIDIVRAAGMVGQRYPTALAVWRFCELQDRGSLRSAFDGLMAMAARRHIHHNAIETVGAVLQWLVKPACTACNGTGFDVIQGTPTLSDHACPVCHGSGKRPTGWDASGRDLYEALLEEQRQATAAIKRKLKND